MAERPPESYTDVPEIEAEIRRVEQEMLETKLLHDNLYIVHNLARNVLHQLNTNILNKPQTNSSNNATTDARNSFQSSNNANCSGANARVCACSPNQCVHLCVPAGTPGNQQTKCGKSRQSNTTDTDQCTSGASPTNTSRSSGPDPTVSSGMTGSTVAEIVIAANYSGTTQQSQQSQNCCSSSYATTPACSQQYSQQLQDRTYANSNPSNSYQCQQASPPPPHYTSYHSQQYPMYQQRNGYQNNTY